MIISKEFGDNTTITVVTTSNMHKRRNIPPNPIDSKYMTVNFYDEVGDLVIIPLHSVKHIIVHY